MLRILLAALALPACTTQPQYRLEVEASTIQVGERVFALVFPADGSTGDPPEVAMPLPASLDATPPGIIQLADGDKQIIGLAPGDAKLTASYDSWSASVMLHVL